MAELIAQRSSYVAGRWTPTADRTFEVENPADETVVAEMAAASVGQVEQAILAARESFDAGVWAERSAADRAQVLLAFLDQLETQKASIVGSCVAEAGQPTWFVEMTQFAGSLTLSRGLIDLYLSMPHEEPNPVPVDELTRGRVVLSVRRYEPIGVVSAITPYNAAFLMAFQKVIPALMAGCSVVLRPSPLTPVSSLALGVAAEAVGIPSGVLNVVIEDGAAGAELMSTHPAVDMVSFTGSTAVGRAILAQAAPTVKSVALELGGKSAQIYLPDAVDKVAAGAGAVVAGTCGQACVAATRMLVPRERKDDVLAAVSAAYGALTVGPPEEQGTMIGPLISAAQRDRCERIVAASEEQGGKVVAGGRRPPHLERGYYFEPTVLDVPDNADPAAAEEIFGPVLSVIGYDDVDHAVQIANDTIYGLSAQVYGADVAAATAVGRRIRSGAVNVNAGGLFSAYAPGGGYKQSGLGRERGTDGIRAFQELKHLVVGELPR